MIEVSRNIMSTQTKGCRFCLHIGTVALYFGRKKDPNASGARLELFTPFHRFRFSRGSNR